MRHLTVRVAWHDRAWGGSVCDHPSANSFCLALDRIREGRNDAYEDSVAGQSWSDLNVNSLPPCQAQAGAFINAREWTRIIEHPYQDIPKASDTHGHLRPTPVNVLAYSTFSVPFWWMTLRNQDEIAARLPVQLPEDRGAPFHTNWVFGRRRQEELRQVPQPGNRSAAPLPARLAAAIL